MTIALLFPQSTFLFPDEVRSDLLMLVSQVDATTLLSPNPYALRPPIIVGKRVTVSFTHEHT